VTAKTFEGPHELRSGVGPLLKLVEHHAGRRIVRGDFDHVAAADPAERDAVVEKQRARILLADPPSLQARPREDEQLRVHRKPQRVERRLQESAAAVERELQRTVLKLPVHVHDGVVQWSRRIRNRRVVGRSLEDAGMLGLDKRPQAAEEQYTKPEPDEFSPVHPGVYYGSS